MVATRRLAELSAQIGSRSEWPDGLLAVALSGGADSATLADLARERAPTKLLHVNHGWPASDRMEKAAGEIADQLQLPLVRLRVESAPVSEGEARTARYRALLEVLPPRTSLLTGHTRDDQAETVLANLMRGSGAEGLAGIPRARAPIFRPLLAVSRAETREYASLAGLAWTDDPANLDPGPLRNRIRNWLIPTLEAEFNPGIREALARAADAFAALESAPTVGQRTENGWRVPSSILWTAGPTRASAMLRTSLRPLRGGYGLDQAECDRIYGVVTGDRTATEISGGWRVEKDGPWLVVRGFGNDSDH